MIADSRTDTTGIVIAGGRSTRFGDREKALAEVAGVPMLRRVVDTLSTIADEVVVNCRRDQRDAFEAALLGVETDVRFAIDKTPDEGPLSGLSTAFTAVDTDFAIALGCDMPLAEKAALSALLARITPADDAVVPQTDAGPEPLHGIYRVAPTAGAASATLADGQRSLRALLDRLSVREVPVGERVSSRSVTSIDTETTRQELDTLLAQTDPDTDA